MLLLTPIALSRTALRTVQLFPRERVRGSSLPSFRVVREKLFGDAYSIELFGSDVLFLFACCPSPPPFCATFIKKIFPLSSYLFRISGAGFLSAFSCD